jgi:hypothetical protein
LIKKIALLSLEIKYVSILLFQERDFKTPDSIRAPRVLLNTMTNRPPDPATMSGSRTNSAELEYDYGKALSIQLDEYDYFR